MRKKWLTFAFIISFLGIIDTSIAIHEYFKVLKGGLETPSFCAISETINCDIVNASSYAQFLGVPTSSLGLLFYITAALFALFARFSKDEKQAALSFVWGMTVVGLLWTLRMAYVSYAILHTYCITCIIHYATNILLVAAFYFASKISFKERLGKIFSKKVFSSALTATIIFGIGYVFSLSAVQSATPKLEEANINEVVDAHFKQSLYDIKPSDIEGAPVWGDPNAKVTIVEFSDFECPFCRIAAFNLKPYLYEFRDKVKFVFMNYPLDNSCNKYMDHPMHQNACAAAKIGVCAQKNSKFWEYHDEMFRNQRKMSLDTIKSVALRTGAVSDDKAFEECFNDPGTLSLVQSNIETAHHIYLQGTPSIFVNNRALRAWRSPEVLRAVVRKEIKKSY